MKKFNKVLEWYFCGLCIILSLVILVGCVIGLVNISKKPAIKQYPACGIVVANDERSETITVEDFNGNHWKFNGIEDWIEGDIAVMIMDDNGTPTIYDDKIISVRYGGWVEGFSER